MIKTTANLLLKNISSRAKPLTHLSSMAFASNNFNGPFETPKRPASVFETNPELRTSNAIAKNVGLKQFVTRMYNTTALSIFGALGTAFVGMNIPLLVANPFVTALVGGVTMIGAFTGMRLIQPLIVTENQPGIPALVYRTQNPISRLFLYGLGVASLGLSASPLFAAYSAFAPSVITSALGITLGIFGGASAVSYMLPKDKMLGYGNIFMGSLLGLLAMQLVGLGSSYFMGPNALSALLFNLNNYLGIAVFTGLIAYDTHVAIKEYEMGYADHLGVSVSMLLNFWNILLRVMDILARMKQ